MPRATRFLAALALLLSSISTTGATDAAPARHSDARVEPRAGSWQEVHQVSDDVRIAVNVQGVATFEHRVRYRIVAGRFHALDVPAIDSRATVIDQATIVPEKGGELAATLETAPKPRIVFDEPKGLTRGSYVVAYRYTLDMRATGALVEDGGMWKLAWTAPPAPEGKDGARVVFELPPAAMEPRAGGGEETTVATVRRSKEKDELELVRAHVPRGEAVSWVARIDPKAFLSLHKFEPSPAPVAPPEPSHLPEVLVAAALAALAALLVVVARAKAAAVERACSSRGVIARRLVPIPSNLAPFVYSGVICGALAALFGSMSGVGAALVVVAMLVGSYRSPVSKPRLRGPGTWAPMDEAKMVSDETRSTSDDVFDVGTTHGKLTLAAVVTGIVAGSLALATRVPGIVVIGPLASTALAPLFVTGTARQLPLSPREIAVRFLRPVRDLLARSIDLAHVDVRCVARYLEGHRAKAFDEIRLLVLPQDRIPGLRAIELAFVPTPSSSLRAVPEILVRFDDGSSAAAKLSGIARGMRVVPGRAPEEKVLSLAPAVPTPEGAANLLAQIVLELEGRRAEDRAPAPKASRFGGVERRRASRPAQRAEGVVEPARV